MADWNAPVVSTAYATTMTNLKDRDVESATMFALTTPTNTPTGAIKLDGASTTSTLQKWSGTVWADAITTWYTPALSVSGAASFGNVLQTGTGVSTGSCVLELGGLRSGDGGAFIDLHATSGTDYEARISRGAGTNGAAYFINTGTGGLYISQTGAGDIVMSTSAAERARIDQDGNLLIGSTTPTRGATGRGLVELSGSTTSMIVLRAAGAECGYVYGSAGSLYINSSAWLRNYATTGHIWQVNGVEEMRLTGTGLGLGTTTPQGAFDVVGNSVVSDYGGTNSSPTVLIGASTPALSVKAFSSTTTQTMMAFSLPNDAASFTDSSQWNFRVTQTANSITSAGVTGMTFAGPGYLALGAGGAERVRIGTAGNVGIGKTNPTVALDVVGAITATGDITAYSDVRLKRNIVLIDGAVDKVKRLSGVTFDRVDHDARSVGLLAQEVRDVLPEAVRDDGEYLSVNYNGLIGLLVEAIKELAA